MADCLYLSKLLTVDYLYALVISRGEHSFKAHGTVRARHYTSARRKAEVVARHYYGKPDSTRGQVYTFHGGEIKVSLHQVLRLTAQEYRTLQGLGILG